MCGPYATSISPMPIAMEGTITPNMAALSMDEQPFEPGHWIVPLTRIPHTELKARPLFGVTCVATKLSI
jgi:hypothetical protein